MIHCGVEEYIDVVGNQEIVYSSISPRFAVGGYGSGCNQIASRRNV